MRRELSPTLHYLSFMSSKMIHRPVCRELTQSEARDVAASIVRSGAELLAPSTALGQRWREATRELAPPPRGYAGPARPAGEPAALEFDMQVPCCCC